MCYHLYMYSPQVLFFHITSWPGKIRYVLILNMWYVPTVSFYAYPTNMYIISLIFSISFILMILITTPVSPKLFKHFVQSIKLLQNLLQAHFIIRVLCTFFPQAILGVLVQSGVLHHCARPGIKCSKYLFYHAIFLWVSC